MVERDDILGVILAGGGARRMGGVDKALVPLAGRPLLDHVVARLRPQVGAVVLSANGDPARYAAFGLEVLADPLDEAIGPLGGLAAGLLHARAKCPRVRRVVTVAVDTPFVPHDLVARFLAATEGDERRIAVAASGGRTHPVAAMHPVEVLDDLLAAIGTGGLRRVMRWIDGKPSVVVDFDDPDGGDPFANLNTPDDLAEAERRVAAARAAR